MRKALPRQLISLCAVVCANVCFVIITLCFVELDGGDSQRCQAAPAKAKQPLINSLTARQEQIPTLGATAIPATAQVDGKRLRCLYLSGVSASSAGHKSGLRSGDVILSINDNVTYSPARINEMLEELSNKFIRVTFARQKNSNLETGVIKACWTFVDTPDAADTKSIAELEQFMLKLINDDRQAAGLAPVTRSKRLSEFARSYATVMSQKEFFSHTDLEGNDLKSRAAAAGIQHVQENLAFQKGHSSKYLVRQCETNFMNEPVNQKNHRGNILDPSNKFVGVGIAFMKDGGVYVAQEFSRYDVP